MPTGQNDAVEQQLLVKFAWTVPVTVRCADVNHPFLFLKSPSLGNGCDNAEADRDHDIFSPRCKASNRLVVDAVLQAIADP